MTLRELLGRIESTKGQKLPTAGKLIESGSTVEAMQELNDGKLTVFHNGFVLYEVSGKRTVFRADGRTNYTYSGRKEDYSFDGADFMDMDWWVRLVMEGEDRMTENLGRSVRFNESSLSIEDEELSYLSSSDFDEQKGIFLQDILNQAFEMMTERQREVATYYYLDGMTGDEIAKIIGVSRSAIACTLSDIKKKMKKNIDMFN
ncbi:MAG: sigma-70 family RNA polymerase sigma factor [Clostridia bacterium]|nr:sigma-70 family RNA polymerase sigma factor [Clostridia bacterium]